MLGRLLPTLNESASDVTPSAETTSTFSTMPVTREANVPNAMILLARETLLFAAGCGADSTSSPGSAPVPAPGSGVNAAGPWILPRRGGVEKADADRREVEPGGLYRLGIGGPAPGERFRRLVGRDLGVPELLLLVTGLPEPFVGAAAVGVRLSLPLCSPLCRA